MARYILYVKVKKEWVPVRAIEAEHHADALRKAISSLAEEHYSVPIKLEQEEKPRPPDAGSHAGASPE